MKEDRSAALRHLVYADLLSALPPASAEQATKVIANLGMHRMDRRIVLTRFLWLKVTPDRDDRRREIERDLAGRYGSRLDGIPGFYFMQDRWRINMPRRCALYGYTGRHGFYNGILCQPLDHIDTYFLLSSAKYGGPKAIRLEEKDRLFFEQYKDVKIAA